MLNTRKLVNLVFQTEIYENKRASVLRDLTRSHDCYKNGHYPYIPIDDFRIAIIVDDILKENNKAVNKDKKQFLDVGCGIPVIPKIMRLFDFQAKGLEYEELYCKAYDDMIHGDMLKYNFSNFDYLYSYNPLSNPEMMMKGLENLLTTMKKGAILYFVKAGNYPFDFKKYGKVTELKGTNSLGRLDIFKIVKK